MLRGLYTGFTNITFSHPTLTNVQRDGGGDSRAYADFLMLLISSCNEHEGERMGIGPVEKMTFTACLMTTQCYAFNSFHRK